MNPRWTVVVSIMAALALSAGLVRSWAEESSGTAEPDLAGLWAASRDFGPEIRGTLDLRKQGERWTARIAGFEAPVRFDENRVTFEIPGDRGRFRGRVDRSAGRIRGHWIQPPTVELADDRESVAAPGWPQTLAGAFVACSSSATRENLDSRQLLHSAGAPRSCSAAGPYSERPR